MGVYKCQGPWVKGDRGECLSGPWVKGIWDGCLTVFGPMGERV